jgi:hypothetical protein
VSWDRRFSDPVELPKGQKLITLRDAALYITKLPKAAHDAKEWQAAMETLILGATVGGADDVRAHRHHASAESSRRTRVRPVAKGQALGTPEAGAGSMTEASSIAASDYFGGRSSPTSHAAIDGSSSGSI